MVLDLAHAVADNTSEALAHLLAANREFRKKSGLSRTTERGTN